MTSGVPGTGNPDGNPNPEHLTGKGRPAGKANKITQEGKGFAKTFVDDERWEAMIWRWVEGVSSATVEHLVADAMRGDITPEECAKKLRAAATPMPAGVFNCIMTYRFGKPPQTVKVKGALGVKPYDDMTDAQLAARAADLATELAINSASAQLSQEKAEEGVE
jgi:hypothetical protein